MSIRLANVSYLCGAPYRALRNSLYFDTNLDIQYQENLPNENARLLNEGEVDIALISVSDFAQHGGYLGLDFGVSVRSRSDILMLYSQKPIEDLSAIHLYEGASSSGFLLRLLCREIWNANPRMIRAAEDEPLRAVSDNEGLLIRHDTPYFLHDYFRYRQDLVEVWHRFTGKPFVLMLWAVKPGVLSGIQHQLLNEALHRSVHARSFLTAAEAQDFGMSKYQSVNFLLEHYNFYLDEANREGLRTFFDLSVKHRLLPKTVYQSARIALFKDGRVGGLRSKGVEELLNDVALGKRLGMQDALSLATKASTADLGISADLVRRRFGSNRCLSYVLALKETSNLREEGVSKRLESYALLGLKHVRLVEDPVAPLALKDLEQLICKLKSDYGHFVEGFSVRRLLKMAVRERISVSEVCSRLVTAGLDLLGSDGTGMLVKRRIHNAIPDFGSWSACIKSLHALGARSICCLRVDPEDTWEDRILHLSKVRSLQDENPGFFAFVLDDTSSDIERQSSEIRMRCLMIARLFLDNVSSIMEARPQDSLFASALSLSFGVNQVCIEINHPQPELIREIVGTFGALREVGMDFESQSFAGQVIGSIH